MKKTVYHCDICGEEKKESLLKSIGSYDVCNICQIIIVKKVLDLKLINLMPWCKTCGGTGIIRESDGGAYYGRPDYNNIPCKECCL